MNELAQKLPHVQDALIGLFEAFAKDGHRVAGFVLTASKAIPEAPIVLTALADIARAVDTPDGVVLEPVSVLLGQAVEAIEAHRRMLSA